MIITIVAAISIGICIFVQHPKFGKLPKRERLARIKQSPHYKNGTFQNLNYTPVLSEGISYLTVSKEFFFKKEKRVAPNKPIPTSKTDLLNLNRSSDVLVWFGHSSYFMQIDEKRILVDPVLSSSVSPLPFGMKAFEGTNIYTAHDIPEIDYLFITHDHWDHLDYKTVKTLKEKIKYVICPLGVGETLELWGYDKSRIIEQDWNETNKLDSNFIAHCMPARHFSGRIFKNKTLWAAYVLETPTMKIFIGGDGGYDVHFAEIGKHFGSIDLALLENGQNNKNWRYIHLMQDEVIQAAKDLHAKRIFPGHSAKFALANHAWDMPLTTLTELSNNANIPLITSLIGEQVNLKDSSQTFFEWWKTVE